jgi:hypothetical protein
LRGRGSYSAHQIRRTDLVDLMSADAVGRDCDALNADERLLKPTT